VLRHAGGAQAGAIELVLHDNSSITYAYETTALSSFQLLTSVKRSPGEH